MVSANKSQLKDFGIHPGGMQWPEKLPVIGRNLSRSTISLNHLLPLPTKPNKNWLMAATRFRLLQSRIYWRITGLIIKWSLHFFSFIMIRCVSLSERSMPRVPMNSMRPVCSICDRSFYGNMERKIFRLKNWITNLLSSIPFGSERFRIAVTIRRWSTWGIFKKIVLACVKKKWLSSDPFVDFKFKKNKVKKLAD